MQESTIPVTIQSYKGETQGQVTLKTVPREQAVKKAVVAWLTCWGIALVTLPIPLVHFIAPPLLLLLGPIIGFVIFKMYNGATDISQGEGPCPDCGVKVPLGPGAAAWPVIVTCPGCQARLSLLKQL